MKTVFKNWKSFYASLKDWKANPSKYTGKPNIPRYSRATMKEIRITYIKPVTQTKSCLLLTEAGFRYFSHMIRTAEFSIFNLISFSEKNFLQNSINCSTVREIKCSLCHASPMVRLQIGSSICN